MIKVSGEGAKYLLEMLWTLVIKFLPKIDIYGGPKIFLQTVYPQVPQNAFSSKKCNTCHNNPKQ